MIVKEQILQQIKQAVLSVDESAEVVLFGSRARGDYNDESDWDVLVLVDKLEDDHLFKGDIRSALYELELKSGQIISSLIRNKLFWKKLRSTPLFWEIEKDGKRL